MRFPDFLIIGAMKSGTTTLYRDLLTNPGVFMPLEKEPHSLGDDAVLTDRGRAAYSALFEGARADQVCGEASTGYTKLPDLPGVPARAKALLPPNSRFLYLVREPVSRAISQHFHELAAGELSEGIDEAIKTHVRLTAYSAYATQASAWLDVFGPERVRVVIFERFVKDRRGVGAEVARFLGIEPRPELIDPERVFNQGDTKPVMSKSGPMRWVQQSWAYRKVLRPMLSLEAREKLRRRLLPSARSRPSPPSEATIDRLIERLSPEADRLADLFGLAKPIWDFARVREKILANTGAGSNVQ